MDESNLEKYAKNIKFVRIKESVMEGKIYIMADTSKLVKDTKNKK